MGFWVLLCLLCPSLATLALDPSRTVHQYNLRSWTRQNGLPANGVNAILQSRDGYLWLGTPAGLARFDGVEFKLHDMGRFRSAMVTSLAGDAQNGVWFGLESGAFGFCDGTEFRVLGRTEWGGSNLTVHSLLQSREGDLWIAAQNLAGRLTNGFHFDPILNTPTGKDFYDVGAVLQDSRGRVWLGTTARGLFYWQKGVLTRFPDPVLDKLTIRSLAEDKQGQLWIGTEAGVLCYDSTFQRQPMPFPWYETRALLADSRGAVWAGTSGSGVVRFLNGISQVLRQSEGLTDDYVTALAEDREGNVWVGTRNGLSQLSDVKLPTFGKTEGLPADVNISVSPSRDGGVWVATGSGLTYFDVANPGRSFTYTAHAGFRNTYLKRVLESRNGELYVINGAMDIEVLAGGKVVARYPNSSWPTALAEDDHGVVAAVGGEIYRVGTNSFVPYAFANDQKPLKCWMYNLVHTRDGSLWTVSAEGISRVRNGITEVVTGPDPTGGAKANWLCEDAEGIVWAGTDSGIARIKDGRIRIITRDNGLWDNLIYAIVPDDRGALWISSGRGFFRVSRQALNDVAEGKVDRVDCAAYDGLEAVKSSERNQQEPSGCKTLDGRVWFPTAQGVVMIDPANVPINRIAPIVDLDKVRVNGEEITKPTRVVAPPGEGNLEFYYTALSLVAPQKTRFRYKLDGYDTDWKEAGDRRLAFYTNLKPGKYTFRVIAANADGIWNLTGDAAEIELQPHYYQSSWFYGVILLLGCAALAGLYSWRIRHLHTKQKALQRARDLLETKVAERTTALADSNALLIREIERREIEVRQRIAAQAELEGQKDALEKEIEERKRIQVEVERIHRELLDASRRAGQAEVASNVLHNVGNVLNSVNVSTSVLTERLRALQISHLSKAVHLIQKHSADLGSYFTSDEKGRKLPGYLAKLTDHLVKEQTGLLAELRELADNVEHIKEIVAMQQGYAKVSGLNEKLSLAELVDGALKLHAASMHRHSIHIVREYAEVPPVILDRHKVLQILINILQNAKYACDQANPDEKKVVIRIKPCAPDRVALEISDNGIGISPENLTRIFSHGFTTRKQGHGFGLHSAALAASQLGGTLTAHSDGIGKGATFTVVLPLKPEPDSEAEARSDRHVASRDAPAVARP